MPDILPGPPFAPMSERGAVVLSIIVCDQTRPRAAERHQKPRIRWLALPTHRSAPMPGIPIKSSSYSDDVLLINRQTNEFLETAYGLFDGHNGVEPPSQRTRA